jgi:hypothetical protein
MNPPGWTPRPVVWFAAASMLTTTLHEFTHACAVIGGVVAQDLPEAATNERLGFVPTNEMQLQEFK